VKKKLFLNVMRSMAIGVKKGGKADVLSAQRFDVRTLMSLSPSSI